MHRVETRAEPEYRSTMLFRISVVSAALVFACLVGGCAPKTQRSPSLTAASKPAAPQHDVFKEAGDTTWQVVTAPARLMAPKKANPKEPETFEAPAAVIVRRNYADDDDAPASQPAPAAPIQKP
jgi:hypothetical protein